MGAPVHMGARDGGSCSYGGLGMGAIPVHMGARDGGSCSYGGLGMGAPVHMGARDGGSCSYGGLGMGLFLFILCMHPYTPPVDDIS